ncbi:hypothetical protein CPB86DRAFT_279897 [Serendipita vermifera]|nr:hypothetical protein CPB86DRAFT_279897 [Serendipita vermifera]
MYPVTGGNRTPPRLSDREAQESPRREPTSSRYVLSGLSEADITVQYVEGPNLRSNIHNEGKGSSSLSISTAGRKTRPSNPLSLWALVIGINRYASPNVSQLNGAVADSEAVKLYLIEDLGVPEDNIRTLIDEEAIRTDIIKGIRWLIEHPSIRRNDPILIFFAGHGGEGPAPERWPAQRSKVQYIVPHDYLIEKEGEKVHGIPDLSIAALLNELANIKGDNIAIILDYSHSVSEIRHRFRRARAAHPDYDIPEDLDQDILKIYRTTEAPKESEFHENASHVLLAACAPEQMAMEIGDRGVFTQALLCTLKAIGFQNLTYDILIRRLPLLPSQNPRCEGKNRDRYLFKTITSPEQEQFYQVTKHDRDYILEAGEIHGLSEGCDLSLYRSANRDGDYLGKAKVLRVDARSSVIEIIGGLISRLPLPFFAVQTLFGQENALHVYIDDDPKLEWLKTAMKSNSHLYSLVTQDAARLVIRTLDDTVTFTFANSFIERLGSSRIPYRVNIAEEALILRVTKAASLFHRYLNYRPLNGTSKYPVVIEYTPLERRGRGEWDVIAQPGGGHNLNQDNQVAIISGGTIYGMKITNKTDQHLYPYLFDFDCSDFSIEPFYEPATAKMADTEIALPPNQSITIGYGDGGGSPWIHYIRDPNVLRQGTIILDKSTIDISLFKLILTTRPADLSFMKQSSPFDEGIRTLVRGEVELPGVWTTELLPIIVTES